MNSGIAVTGLGLITPLGVGADENWAKLSQGASLTEEPAPVELPGGLSALARCAPFENPNGRHRIFPMAKVAAREALEMSGVLGCVPPERIGCSLSVSKPIFCFDSGGGSVNFLEQYLPEAVGRHASREFNLMGPRTNFVAACATGAHSIQAASRWLDEGLCDAVLCGSVESSLHPLIVSGFRQLGVLSAFPRPFDRDRSGFTMAEGAGLLVLERADLARARGAKILAELAGTALGADVNHPTAFSEEGASVFSTLRRALDSAKISPRDVQYVNAHGTGTVKNDRLEARALERAFESCPDLSVSSTKAATGHLLGASAGVEAVVACLSLQHQFVPPTVHLENPESGLDLVPRIGRSKRVDHALSLSFGFGGPIGAVVFRRAGS